MNNQLEKVMNIIKQSEEIDKELGFDIPIQPTEHIASEGQVTQIAFMPSKIGMRANSASIAGRSDMAASQKKFYDAGIDESESQKVNLDERRPLDYQSV